MTQHQTLAHQHKTCANSSGQRLERLMSIMLVLVMKDTGTGKAVVFAKQVIPVWYSVENQTLHQTATYTANTAGMGDVGIPSVLSPDLILFVHETGIHLPRSPDSVHMDPTLSALFPTHSDEPCIIHTSFRSTLRLSELIAVDFPHLRTDSSLSGHTRICPRRARHLSDELESSPDLRGNTRRSI